MIELFYLFSPLLADLTTANQLFEATLYTKAAQMYEQDGLRSKQIESLYLAGDTKSVISKLENNDPKGIELYYLALSFQHEGNYEKMFQTKETYLDTLEGTIKETYKNELHEQKAAYFLNQKNSPSAELELQKLPSTAENYFRLIKLKENRKAPETEIHDLKMSLLSLPHSPYHEQVAFELHTFQDYMMGDKKALAYLQEFLKTYKNSRFAIAGWYLIGLDMKKERRPEGKRRIHHKNLDQALLAFAEAETVYQNLNLSSSDPERHYWQTLYERAKFERAKTLLDIAEEGNPLKKHIFLTYASEVLASLTSPEATLLLIQTHLKDGNMPAAFAHIEKLEKDLRTSEKENNVLLAKLLIEKGKLLYYRGDASNALEILSEAERKAPAFSLTADEQLQLSISKALCYKDLKDFDSAMLLLSDVINSDFVSALRIKAMYMRALVYETSGRPELARRQFDTAFLKGGEWAEQTKETWHAEFVKGLKSGF